MNISQNSRVAMITGAAQGIGRAIALRLAKEGIDICLVDLNQEKLNMVAEEVKLLGVNATTFKADVSRQHDVIAAIDHTEKYLNGFDIMINNAGISQVGAIKDITQESFRIINDINVGGVLWGIQGAANKFIANNTKGKIINAASVAGHEGFALLSIYSATKFAVRSLTQSAAKEFASKGITVNCYCPGVVGTDMWVDMDRQFSELTGAPLGETYKKYVENISLGRAQTPEDVANVVAFLASTDSDYITGQSIITDGGIIFR